MSGGVAVMVEGVVEAWKVRCDHSTQYFWTKRSREENKSNIIIFSLSNICGPEGCHFRASISRVSARCRWVLQLCKQLPIRSRGLAWSDLTRCIWPHAVRQHLIRPHQWVKLHFIPFVTSDHVRSWDRARPWLRGRPRQCAQAFRSSIYFIFKAQIHSVIRVCNEIQYFVRPAPYGTLKMLMLPSIFYKSEFLRKCKWVFKSFSKNVKLCSIMEISLHLQGRSIQFWNNTILVRFLVTWLW